MVTEDQYWEFVENNTIRDQLPGTWDALFGISIDTPDKDGFVIIDVPPAGKPPFHEATLVAGNGSSITVRPYKNTHFEILRRDPDGNTVSDFHDPQNPLADGKIVDVVEAWTRKNCAGHPDLERRVEQMRDYVQDSARQRREDELRASTGCSVSPP
jgi:hypothetical protein